jgi:N-acetylmuramoyl-L-alanine amidase
MKKTNLILSMVLIMIFFSATLSFSDQDIVCIDPGHGGPGADKFHNGGDGYGGAGPVLGIAEQWVNFQVALELYEMIQFGTFYNVIMTRTSEGDTSIPTNHTRNLWYRANKANYGDNGNPVDQFISIHHNGIEPAGTTGTEVFWTSVINTDSGDSRYYGVWLPAYQDSLLAMKIHFRLLDLWHYTDRCSSRCGSNPLNIYCCDKNYFVVRNTVMPSALSEASNLNDAVEESLFNNPETGHAEAEAFAIFEGWESHRDNMGIAIVKNAYSGGNEGKVVIADWNCYNDDTTSSPYFRCWLMHEQYCLKAITPQIINGHEYAFHHWTHLDPWGGQIGDDMYQPIWPIIVWAEWDYHRYVAYFTGGPYSAQVVSPNGWETWYVAEQEIITWNVSPGADSTTYVDIFLDRNGGNDGYPEKLVDSIPGAYYDGWTWTVTGPVSTHCRIKIVVYDRAGNSDEDVSNYDFSITGSGNNNPEIDRHLHCKYPYEECNDCIKYGGSFTLEVNAHDPDGDSIYYEWYAFALPFPGHFGNGYDTMTTAENYVEYFTPAKAEAESPVQGGDDEPKQEDVFLMVMVVDVRGGSNFITGYLGLYEPETSCLCGDANGDSVGNVGDLVFFATYLFQEGPPPPEPIERADVNNDCEVDIADLIYLATYHFCSGPPPECGWICPPDLKTPNSGSDDQISGKFLISF